MTGLGSQVRASLLVRRSPVEDIEVGYAYVVHACNGGVGVAVQDDHGAIGSVLHRKKLGDHYLFTEWDWDNGPPFGTAIPLRKLDVEPSEDDDALLMWLSEREEEHREEIQGAWDGVLGLRMGRFSANGGGSTQG